MTSLMTNFVRNLIKLHLFLLLLLFGFTFFSFGNGSVFVVEFLKLAMDKHWNCFKSDTGGKHLGGGMKHTDFSDHEARNS